MCDLYYKFNFILMKYELPKLSYEYNALEPFIDKQTMEVHYSKHHQAYINNLNTVLEKYENYQSEPLEKLLSKLSSLEMQEADKKSLRNHGGGHLNHSLFWTIMGPHKLEDGSSAGELKIEIINEFQSIGNFKKLFSEVALKHFGSGWAWLARDEKGKLQIYSLPNQDSPYLTSHTPVIGLDVWEHAYYLKYQNRRAEYIENWWNVLKFL